MTEPAIPVDTSEPSWLRPKWGRLLVATIVAGVGFVLPQEVPLEWYPLNNPGPDINYLELTCASNVHGEVQIYYDLDQGFNELHSIRFPISPTEQAFTYTFPLPDAPITALRLDSVVQGGTLTIRQMRIINRREELIQRFTLESFRPRQQVANISPMAEGWKIISSPTAYDPVTHVELLKPIIPVGMNRRNLLRCLLSTGYLAGMLFILLMAVLTATWRPRGWRDFFIHAGFMAGLALLFAPVGNRGLIRNSFRYAIYEPPLAKPGVALEFDAVTSSPTTAQMYWDTGDGFSEEESSKYFYENRSGLQVLRFPLPTVPLRQLRFDPLVNEGRVEIRSIRLVDADGRTVTKLQIDCLRPENEIAELESKNGSIVIQTAPNSHDPITRFTSEAVATINQHLAPMSGNAHGEKARTRLSSP